MTVPLKVDLAGKTAAITGGGASFADAWQRPWASAEPRSLCWTCGKRPPRRWHKKIIEAGGKARGYACNVLQPDSLKQVAEKIEGDLGPVDILVNGAGGNHPKGTTSKEFLFAEDVDHAKAGLVTFYDLDPEGIQFVFNLNFLGTLLPTQAFTKGMVAKQKGVVVNISSMNAFTP